LIDSDIGVD